MFKPKTFSLKFNGRSGITYKESGRRMLIDSEMLDGKTFDMVIYRDSIKCWQPPHDDEPVSEEKRRDIEDNIRMDLRRYRVDWQ